MFKAIVGQRTQILDLAEIGGALEGADADVAVLEADQHRGTCRGGLVVPRQRLDRFSEGEALAGLDSQRLQHLGRPHLADAALHRQSSVAKASGRASWWERLCEYVSISVCAVSFIKKN